MVTRFKLFLHRFRWPISVIAFLGFTAPGSLFMWWYAWRTDAPMPWLISKLSKHHPMSLVPAISLSAISIFQIICGIAFAIVIANEFFERRRFRLHSGHLVATPPPQTLHKKPVPSIATPEDHSTKLKIHIDENHAFRADRNGAIFWRVDIISQSPEPIVDCSAYLTKIERNGAEKWGGHKVALAFETREGVDSSRITIAPGARESLDVLITTGDSLQPATVPYGQWPYSEQLHTIFEEKGDYVFTVEIEAANIQASGFQYKFTRDRRLIYPVAIGPLPLRIEKSHPMPKSEIKTVFVNENNSILNSALFPSALGQSKLMECKKCGEIFIARRSNPFSGLTSLGFGYSPVPTVECPECHKIQAFPKT